MKTTHTIYLCNGSDYGHHGFGDTPERAACNPARNLEEKWAQAPADFMALVEQHGVSITGVVIRASESGSYHERWCAGDITLALDIPWEAEDEFHEALHALPEGPETDMEAYGVMRERNVRTKELPFTSLEDAQEVLFEMIGKSDESAFKSFVAKPDEDREEYWARQIALAKAQKGAGKSATRRFLDVVGD